MTGTRPARRSGRHTAAGLVLALVVAGPWAATAGATTTSPTTPAPAAPSGGGDRVMPVVDLVAPVYPIVSSIRDVDGVATVDERAETVDVRLDANVLFAKDSATIRPAGEARLREVGERIRARGPATLRIDGYTDDLGSAAHGRELSRRRAEAVAARLRAVLPAASYRFVVRGRGETGFVAPNTSEENRRKNRRVEIHVEPSTSPD